VTAEGWSGIGADDGGGGQRLALRLFPALVVLAPPRCLSQRISVVSAGHLHAVDAEIEGILARSPGLGDDERPSDEGRRLARPATLDRQRGEVDVAAVRTMSCTARRPPSSASSP